MSSIHTLRTAAVVGWKDIDEGRYRDLEPAELEAFVHSLGADSAQQDISDLPAHSAAILGPRAENVTPDRLQDRGPGPARHHRCRRRARSADRPRGR